MGSSLLVIIFCAIALVVGGLAGLLVVLMNPANKQTQVATENARRPRKDWKSWIPIFGIALVLFIWSGWIALLFFVTAWIMRLDPKPYQREIPYPSDRDRDSAKGLYIWLLLSPFLTVPTMIIAALFLDWNSSTNERVFAALIPVIFHLPLLFSLNPKRPFVYRHAQQAIFLVALRAGMASIAMSIGTYPGDGAWLFLLGNGALWLFGSLWARGQAARRECWWVKWKGEAIIPAEVESVEKFGITGVPLQHLDTRPSENEREDSPSPIQPKGTSFRQKTLHTFRTGTPEERARALHLLFQLGEVEKF